MPAVPAAVHRLVASKKAPVEPAEPVIFKPSLSCGYGCGTAAGTFGIIPFQEFLSVVDGRLLLQHNMYFPAVQAAHPQLCIVLLQFSFERTTVGTFKIIYKGLFLFVNPMIAFAAKSDIFFCIIYALKFIISTPFTDSSCFYKFSLAHIIPFSKSFS